MQFIFARREVKATVRGGAKNDGTNGKVKMQKQPDIKTGAW